MLLKIDGRSIRLESRKLLTLKSGSVSRATINRDKRRHDDITADVTSRATINRGKRRHDDITADVTSRSMTSLVYCHPTSCLMSSYQFNFHTLLYGNSLHTINLSYRATINRDKRRHDDITVDVTSRAVTSLVYCHPPSCLMSSY
ncbi:hypothetical protein J6590_101035 [Homalodisca vitripennis]|nr:hypothetical protein J6590_101035 [Homalodisca vitripennis]